MLKKDITYENFDGETITTTHHFNLTKTELMEFDWEHEGGFPGFIQQIVNAKDVKGLLDQFKKVILLSYGVREGDRFIKSEEVREAFKQTLAYDAIVIEMIADDTAAVDFLEGALPRDLVQKVKEDTKKEAEKSNVFSAPIQDPNAPIIPGPKHFIENTVVDL